MFGRAKPSWTTRPNPLVPVRSPTFPLEEETQRNLGEFDGYRACVRDLRADTLDGDAVTGLPRPMGVQVVTEHGDRTASPR
jgi:hypothetical protein